MKANPTQNTDNILLLPTLSARQAVWNMANPRALQSSENRSPSIELKFWRKADMPVKKHMWNFWVDGVLWENYLRVSSDRLRDHADDGCG